MRRLEEALHDLAEQDRPIATDELINRVERDLTSESADARVVSMRETHPTGETSEQLLPLSRRWNPIAAAAVVAGAVILFVGLPLLLLRGDSPVADEPVTEVPVSTTETDIVSTTVAVPETTSAPEVTGTERPIIEVTFDGEGCSVTGPTSVPAAAGQAFLLTNDSDIGVTLRVARIRYDHFDALAAAKPGVKFETFDDLVTLYETDPAAISEYWLLQEERLSFDPEHYPDIERADNQVIDVRLLGSSRGEDAIHVTSIALDRTWFCGPLEVTAAEF